MRTSLLLLVLALVSVVFARIPVSSGDTTSIGGVMSRPHDSSYVAKVLTQLLESPPLPVERQRLAIEHVARWWRCGQLVEPEWRVICTVAGVERARECQLGGVERRDVQPRVERGGRPAEQRLVCRLVCVGRALLEQQQCRRRADDPHDPFPRVADGGCRYGACHRRLPLPLVCIRFPASLLSILCVAPAPCLGSCGRA